MEPTATGFAEDTLLGPTAAVLVQRKQAEIEEQTAGETNREETTIDQFQECCEWPVAENETDAGIVANTMLEPTAATEIRFYECMEGSTVAEESEIEAANHMCWQQHLEAANEAEMAAAAAQGDLEAAVEAEMAATAAQAEEMAAAVAEAVEMAATVAEAEKVAAAEARGDLETAAKAEKMTASVAEAEKMAVAAAQGDPEAAAEAE